MNNHYFIIKNNEIVGLTESGKQQEKLIIPDGITCIRRFAFQGCKSLIQVVIPLSVKTIWYDVFKGCPSLTSTGVINHSTVLFDWWVQNHDYNGQTLSQMTDIDLNNFTNSDGQAFTKISYSAFAECDSLRSITIPNSITFISAWAFRNCLNLTSISIPNSIISIGGGIFAGCPSLTSAGVINHSTVLFDWWVQNHQYILPDGSKQTLSKISDIDLNNFTNSDGKHFTVIAFNAFQGCESLISIIIPNSIISIGIWSFNGCKSLKTVKNYAKIMSLNFGAFSNCESLEQIYLPYTLKFIDSQVFLNCESLKQITIPNSVKKIGREVFANCSSLKQIYLMARTIWSIDYEAFINCHPNAQYYVPNDEIKQVLINSSSLINPLQIIVKGVK